MESVDIFALAVLALGIAALGLSVILEGTRMTAASSRHALLRHRIQTRADELAARTRRIDDTAALCGERQGALDRLVAERARLTAVLKSIEATKTVLVHELGEPEAGAQRFDCDLRTAPDFNRIDARRVVFAREIWERPNVARVWADTPDAALAHLQRAFNTRSGIIPARPQRAEAAVGGGGANRNAALRRAS